MDTYNMKMENEDDDDMGLQLALKKARKLKQLEKIERKPDLADTLIVSIFFSYLIFYTIVNYLVYYYINLIIYK